MRAMATVLSFVVIAAMGRSYDGFVGARHAGDGHGVSP